jgi:hypothetical protein
MARPSKRDRGGRVTAKTQDRQIALRVTQETIDRAERLAPVMQKRPEWEPFRMTASAVMRAALLKGLDRLESEMKGTRRS